MYWVGGAAFAAASLTFLIYTADPTVPRWAAIFTFTIILLLAGTGWLYRARPTFRPFDWALLALLGWIALSVTWSSDYRQGLLELQRAVALGVLVFAFSRASPERLATWIPVCANLTLLAVMLLYAARPGISGGFGNSNWLLEWVAITLPLAAWAIVRRPMGWAAIPAVVLGGWHVATSGSNAKWLLLAVPVVCAVPWLVRRRQWFALAVLALVVVNGALWMGAFGDPRASVLARAEIWINTAAIWSTAPWVGVGLGGFDWNYDLFREFHMPYLGATLMERLAIDAGLAHNELLQIVSEIGLVGLALAVICVLFMGRAGGPPAVTLAVAGVLSMVGFPLHFPSSAFVIMAAVGLHVSRSSPHPFVVSGLDWLGRAAMVFVPSVYLEHARFAGKPRLAGPGMGGERQGGRYLGLGRTDAEATYVDPGPVDGKIRALYRLQEEMRRRIARRGGQGISDCRDGGAPRPRLVDNAGGIPDKLQPMARTGNGDVDGAGSTNRGGSTGNVDGRNPLRQSTRRRRPDDGSDPTGPRLAERPTVSKTC